MAFIANSGENSVSVINTELNQVVAKIITSSAAPVAVSPAYNSTAGLIVHRDDGIITGFNMATELAGTSSVGGDPVYITTSRSPYIVHEYIANENTNTISAVFYSENQSIEVGVGPRKIVAHPENLTLYVLNAGDGTLSLVSEPGPPDFSIELVSTIPVAGLDQALRDFVLTSDGASGFLSMEDTVSGDFSISVLSTSDNTITPLAETAVANAGTLYVGPDGTLAYAEGSATGVVSRVDVNNGDVVPARADFGGMAVLADGSALYVIDTANDQVLVLNDAADTVITTIAVGAQPVSPGHFIGPRRFKAANLDIANQMIPDLAVGDAAQFFFSLSNSGTLPVNIESITIKGTDAQFFTIKNSCTSNVAPEFWAIHPGISCSVTVDVDASVAGNLTANVEFMTDASPDPIVATMLAVVEAPPENTDTPPPSTAPKEASSVTEGTDNSVTNENDGLASLNPLFATLLLLLLGLRRAIVFRRA